MPNIAAALRAEIARLTRKELRGQSGGLKKASTQHRRDIATLKRQVASLERQVSLLEKTSPEKDAGTSRKRQRHAGAIYGQGPAVPKKASGAFSR